MSRDAIDAAAATFGSKATYTGGGAAVIGGVTSNELLTIVGVVVAVLGFITNLYFQHKRDMREEREHQRRMEHMRTKPGDLA